MGGLNSQHRELLSPYTITLGDEFQAVFGRADSVFPDILAIMRDLLADMKHDSRTLVQVDAHSHAG